MVSIRYASIFNPSSVLNISACRLWAWGQVRPGKLVSLNLQTQSPSWKTHSMCMAVSTKSHAEGHGRGLLWRRQEGCRDLHGAGWILGTGRFCSNLGSRPSLHRCIKSQSRLRYIRNCIRASGNIGSWIASVFNNIVFSWRALRSSLLDAC